MIRCHGNSLLMMSPWRAACTSLTLSHVVLLWTRLDVLLPHGRSAELWLVHFFEKGHFMCRNSFMSWCLQLTGQSYGRGGVYVHIWPRPTWWCHQQAPPNQYCSSVSSVVIGSYVDSWWSFGGFKLFFFLRSDVEHLWFCGTPSICMIIDYWLLIGNFSVMHLDTKYLS